MLQRSLGAVLAAILLAPGIAMAQIGESPIRLPEAAADEFGSGQTSSTPYSAASSEGQVVVPGSIPPAAVGSEDPAQFVAADQLQQAPVEQRLLTMEKEWKAFQAAQDAQKSKYPSAVTVLGVFQADAVAFSQDAANKRDYGLIEDGAGFRRARLGAKGSVANNMNYFFQMDFGFFGRPTFTDVWVEWTDLPWLGTVRAGQWKQPFSLEVVSSFRYTTFMERSSMFQAFDPFRHIGIGFYNHSEDLMTTWAASMFRTGQDQYGNSISTDGGNGVCGRITHLGWWDEASEGRSYLHMGAGYFFNAPPRDIARFRSIPEIFVGEHAVATAGSSGQGTPGVLLGTPFFVDTLALPNTNSIHTPGLELLYVNGPLSIQSEAMAAVVNRDNSPTAILGGGYAQIGWFLTGEHRPYDRVAGAIDRVKPFEDFFWVNTAGGRERGVGAWEVAARYSYIDLNDSNIRGGIMQNVTGGVNWYCNPYCKVVFNYIHSFVTDRNGSPSEANAWGLRTQLDF
jgi:phosphate-selective porin OprO/OprP